MILAVVVVLAILSTVCVIGRLISRRMKGNNLWWDDYTILGALVRTPHASSLVSFFAHCPSGFHSRDEFPYFAW